MSNRDRKNMSPALFDVCGRCVLTVRCFLNPWTCSLTRSTLTQLKAEVWACGMRPWKAKLGVRVACEFGPTLMFSTCLQAVTRLVAFRSRPLDTWILYSCCTAMVMLSMAQLLVALSSFTSSWSTSPGVRPNLGTVSSAVKGREPNKSQQHTVGTVNRWDTLAATNVFGAGNGGSTGSTMMVLWAGRLEVNKPDT